MALKFKTYAENIRVTAKSKDNAQGRPVSIRDLANMSGFSYEHIRKIWMGKRNENARFSVSKECNEILCEILGLDTDEMWNLSIQEKFSQRTGHVPMQLISDPEGRELSEIWEQLSHHQHAILLEMARSFAGQMVEQHVR